MQLSKSPRTPTSEFFHMNWTGHGGKTAASTYTLEIKKNSLNQNFEQYSVQSFVVRLRPQRRTFFRLGFRIFAVTEIFDTKSIFCQLHTNDSRLWQSQDLVAVIGLEIPEIIAIEAIPLYLPPAVMQRGTLPDQVPLMFHAEKGQFDSSLLFDSLNKNVVSIVHSNYP